MKKSYWKTWTALLLAAVMILPGCGRSVVSGGGTEGSAAEVDDRDSSVSEKEITDVDTDADGADTDSDPEVSIPEGSQASKLTWVTATFKGLSYKIPTEWKKTDPDSSGNKIRYDSHDSGDLFFIVYYPNVDLTEEERTSPLSLPRALDGIDQSYGDSVPGYIGSQTIRIYNLENEDFDGNPCDVIAYQIPIGDYGLALFCACHSKIGDHISDYSVLETILGSIGFDDTSIPVESKNLGITDLGMLPVTLVDEADVRITADGISQDEDGKYYIDLTATNNTEDKLNITVSDMEINGYNVGNDIIDRSDTGDTYGIFELDRESTKELSIRVDDPELYNITEIGKVGLSISCTDSAFDDVVRTGFMTFTAVEDYDPDDYITFTHTDDILYEDDNVCISYVGLIDGKPNFVVMNKTDDKLDVRMQNIYVNDAPRSDLTFSVNLNPRSVLMDKIYGTKKKIDKDEVNFETNLTITVGGADKYTTEARGLRIIPN